MEVLLIFIGLYLFCVGMSWWFFHRLYSKNGRYEFCYPNIFDLVLTFLPIFNFFVLIEWLFIGSKKRERLNLNKFFNIKR